MLRLNSPGYWSDCGYRQPAVSDEKLSQFGVIRRKRRHPQVNFDTFPLVTCGGARLIEALESTRMRTIRLIRGECFLFYFRSSHAKAVSTRLTIRQVTMGKLKLKFPFV
jgi:hypothetical protein